MEKLFELTFQDQTLNPQVGTFTDTPQTTGTFTLEDGEYYLTNGDTKGFYAYKPVAMQSGLTYDGKVIIEFDLKVVTASANTHTIIGTYAGVDGSGIPTGAKITLQYNAGDIELVLGSGATETLIAAADVVVDQWYHFRIDCALNAAIESTYEVKIDGTAVTTVTGATTDYELGIISVLGTDQYACDECGIKNITLVTETNMFVGRTALDQALQDVKGYVGNHYTDLTGAQTVAGDKTFTGTTTTHDVIPATTDTYDLGSSTKEYNNAYIKALTVNGTAAGDILTHNAVEFVPRSGGAVMTGDLAKTTNDSSATYCGGTSFDNGASVRVHGKDFSDPSYAGTVLMRAKNNSNSYDLFLRPDGTAMWGSKNVAMYEDTVPRGGGAVITGGSLGRTTESDALRFDGGNGYLAGASLTLFGRYANPGGVIALTCSKYGSTKGMLLYPDGAWTWEGTACQLVSDQRLKQQITEIDDKLLDAWEDVNLVQFKYNDAVDTKGNKARLHTGFVVQQIDSACKKHGVDISEYGLYCHEEYPQETEEVEVEQADGTKTKETKVIREASEHYSLRYTEALIVECKYLRRCIARLTARIEQLEKEREASK